MNNLIPLAYKHCGGQGSHTPVASLTCTKTPHSALVLWNDRTPPSPIFLFLRKRSMSTRPEAFRSLTWISTRPIINVGTTMWRTILGLLTSIGFLGGLVLMTCISGDSKEGNSTDDTNNNNSPTAPTRRFTLRKLVKVLSTLPGLRTIRKPTSFWPPSIFVTFLHLGAYRLLEDRHLVLSGTPIFHTSCPLDGRRTQTGALIKLLAATVTTLGIHGHLGSLAGSESLFREFFRAIEVLISPLTCLVTLSSALYFEVATLIWWQGPWDISPGVRYRLGRMCKLRLDADMPSLSSTVHNLHLCIINPKHLKPVPLRRDVKWVGRELVLVVLLGQYVQTAVLLTRRHISNTSAMVDTAMFLMVVSGLTGLIQSLIISSIHMAWTIDTNFEPCTRNACRLPECITFKNQSDLPTYQFHYKPWGIDLTGVPRQILNGLVAGQLQIGLMFRKKTGLWSALSHMIGLYIFWEGTVRMIFYTEEAVKFWGHEDNSSNPASMPGAGPVGVLPESITPSASTTLPSPTTSTHQEHDDSSPTPLPAPVTSKEDSGMFSFGMIVFCLVVFVIGLASIAFTLMGLFAQLWNLFGPCLTMYLRIAEDTAGWSTWMESEPCPRLWKDSLEDELWWV